MTAQQRAALGGVFAAMSPALFRHGCCVGADAQAAVMADALTPRPTIFGHPSDISQMTSDAALAVCDDTAQPEPPLDRNRHIVDGCDVLVACPKGYAEEQRSGTWATVRFARKVGRPVTIIWPDGRVDRTTPDGW